MDHMVQCILLFAGEDRSLEISCCDALLLFRFGIYHFRRATVELTLLQTERGTGSQGNGFRILNVKQYTVVQRQLPIRIWHARRIGLGLYVVHSSVRTCRPR